MNKNLKILCACVAVFNFASFYQINSLDIKKGKGTLELLPPEMMHLSPIHGVVFLKKLAMHLYDYGHAIAGEPKNKPHRNDYASGDAGEAAYEVDLKRFKKEYSEWLGKFENPIAKIVRDLFYRIPGTTSAGDFIVSSLITGYAKSSANKAALAKKIAKTVFQVWFVANYRSIVLELSIKSSEFVKTCVLTRDVSVKGETIIEAMDNNELGGGAVPTISSFLAVLWSVCSTDKNAMWAYYEELKTQMTDLSRGAFLKTLENKTGNMKGQTLKNAKLKIEVLKGKFKELSERLTLDNWSRLHRPEEFADMDPLKQQLALLSFSDLIIPAPEDLEKYVPFTQNLEKLVYVLNPGLFPQIFHTNKQLLKSLGPKYLKNFLIALKLCCENS
jgi:hypothetical protein